MPHAPLTIGRLARAANVGVETIRYYQKRKLLPIPEITGSAFRYYPRELVDRLRFIKRAQSLGFSLDEIAALLKLEDGTNRKAIRKIAGDHLLDIERRIADLKKMQSLLSHMIHECEMKGHAKICPIIATLAGADFQNGVTP